MGRFVRIGFDRIDPKYTPKYTPGMTDKTENRLRPPNIPKLLQTVGSHNDGGSLYLVVRRKGSGAWVFQFRDGPKLRSKGLGAHPEVTLAMARQRRDAARKGHKDEPQKPKSAGQSFEVLAEEYFEHHATALGTAQLERNRALLRLYAGPLMKRRVNRITRQEVADVLRPIWLGSSNSKGVKLRALMERILDTADDERNPATLRRLRNLLPAKSKKAKKSVPVASLPYRQLPALYAELAAVSPEEIGSTAARVLRFLILTSVRLKEGSGARLSEIDYDKRGDEGERLGAIWTIPAERMKIKDDGDHEVPLSAEALALLREAAGLREMQDDNTSRGVANDGPIFPGRWVDECIGRNAIHLALKRLQTGPLGPGKGARWLDKKGRKITVHGFRSTMATWAQEQRSADGVRLFDQETIDGALAHFVGGVTGTYQRSQHLEARRKLASAWGTFASTSQLDAPLVPDTPNRVEATRKKSKAAAQTSTD
jgi:integrase